MAGVNPYIKPAEIELPTQRYSITFLPSGKVFDVDPEQIPYDRTGREGSILDISAAAGIDIDHSCGGVCACSTCHVIVREGLESCNEPTDDELDQLDNAPGVTTESRLACQCVPNGSCDLVVEVPEWNRNAVKEGH